MTAEPHTTARNPGPSWGYQFLRAADRVLPEALFRPARAAGTLIAMAAMPGQRRHSRQYLAAVLGRTPTARDVFRHFFAFAESLMQRLRLANGREVPCEYMPGAEAFRAWLETGGAVLLGTMHVGVSDMLGFQLAVRSKVPIYLVRERVGNSHDTEALARLYGTSLNFIWVNDPPDMLFSLKDALESDSAVAIQCDRVEHGARTEPFEFLGARRLFPFTIYHLALIFGRRVILCFGMPGREGRSHLFGSPVFSRIPGEAREAALERARQHFQGFLRLLEVQLRANPYVWFNFLPLNAPAPAADAPPR